MMLQAMFRPLDKPIAAPTGGHKRCTFSSTWTNTLNVLEREMKHLKASDIVVELALTSDDIRNDGWPRSSARPQHPGVRISWRSKTFGDMCRTCNTFDFWEHNIRAIALTLELLRRVERYGAIAGAEVYAGFKALPAGEFATKQDAARTLLQFVYDPPTITAAQIQSVIDDAATRREVFRAAAARAHPDRSGGSQERMSRVNRARDFLEAEKS
ncbi:MAG: hypothetical protein SFZ23_08715 [Planctomycetota bacterium]|nr:hypothetical protein [Planctomycetota bacterium]